MRHDGTLLLGMAQRILSRTSENESGQALRPSQRASAARGGSRRMGHPQKQRQNAGLKTPALRLRLSESSRSRASLGCITEQRSGSSVMKPLNLNMTADGDLDIGFLHEIATRMSQAPPLHEVLREVIRFASAVVECDSCFVYVLEKDELVLRSSKNPHPEIIDRLKLKLGEGITGWVGEHREPVAVPRNAMKDPRFKFFNDLPEDRFEAFLSVPLMSRGRLVGVINLQNRKAHNYNKREITLISTVGALAGAEIEMARLQDEERRRIGREVHDSLGQELTA